MQMVARAIGGRNTLPEARRAATAAWERADVELVDSSTIELPAMRVRYRDRKKQWIYRERKHKFDLKLMSLMV